MLGLSHELLLQGIPRPWPPHKYRVRRISFPSLSSQLQLAYARARAGTQGHTHTQKQREKGKNLFFWGSEENATIFIAGGREKRPPRLIELCPRASAWLSGSHPSKNERNSSFSLSLSIAPICETPDQKGLQAKIRIKIHELLLHWAVITVLDSSLCALHSNICIQNKERCCGEPCDFCLMTE